MAHPNARAVTAYLLLVAVLLGLLEGATEFIPVSSTGHLIIASDLLGYTGRQADAFAVFIQLGAVLAIAWLYRGTFVALVARRDASARRLAVNVAIATVPAVVVGFLAHDFIMTHLFSPVTVAAALIVGGFGILAIEAWGPPARVETVGTVPRGTALAIGVAQVLALFPGVSRSGATIMGGYALGLSRTAATEFSFFLAIPIMLAASGYELLDARDAIGAGDAGVLAVGFAVSFVSALVVVKLFLRFVSTHSFRFFAHYRIVLGAVLLLYYGLLR
jgi:undecaprenyl-diphosphatase